MTGTILPERTTCQPALKIDPPSASNFDPPWRLVRQSVSGLDAPTVVSGLDDVTVMGDPVQQGRGHLTVPEDLRPFAEGQVGGDVQRGALIEFGEQVEEELTPG